MTNEKDNRILAVSEEDLKNKIRERYFPAYSTSGDLKKIDFTVREKESPYQELFDKAELSEVEYFLWAEAKRDRHEVEDCLAQLILTIGKNHIAEKNLPPKYLGAFDNEKIAFVEFTVAQPLFNRSDFRWNDVTPSDEETPEFKIIRDAVKDVLGKKQTVFYYGTDDKELKTFIKKNFVQSSRTGQIQITKTNFIAIYHKWCERVKPSIRADWAIAKKKLILDSDFFLADLFVDEKIGQTIQESLKVLLCNKHYTFGSFVNEMGFTQELKAEFSDDQKAYKTFWNKYKRPPRKEFWKYILSRRDLLVPQDVRERKGAFFTPPQWSDLSKKYLADTLGENWQDEYYIWDCCCGTGNLEIGLTNRKNIFASTLDTADIKIINQMIKDSVISNLFENHVFQFDFLNDPFLAQKDGGKLPDKLAEILNDPEKRKKLVIYINPPYAEVSTKNEGKKSSKSGVNQSAIHEKYQTILGVSGRELFTQFFVRIYKEIPDCILGNFSKLKIIQGSSTRKLREVFLADLKSLFIVPASTFDNVRGEFPIGFFVWDLKDKKAFEKIDAMVFDKIGKELPSKQIIANQLHINSWISKFSQTKVSENKKDFCDLEIGWLDGTNGSDMQHNNYVYIKNTKEQVKNPRGTYITAKNLFQVSIYNAIRHSVEANWLNDHDQFLFPNDGWKSDIEFQTDCLVFTLFHDSNTISTELSVNDWIPFTEDEMGVHSELKSSFMSDFIAGKIKVGSEEGELFAMTLAAPPAQSVPLSTAHSSLSTFFSPEARAVYDAGLEVFRYYHSKPNTLTDASLYDIKVFFKGRNEKGKMNATSTDETFNTLMVTLQDALKTLAKQIEPKIYQYGFLV